MKRLFLLFCILRVLFSGNMSAQILTMIPANPSIDIPVVLRYDATQGNGELAGYTGDVYMHTGVITIESAHPGDWKYVKTDWGQNTPETKMTYLGNDIYQAEFTIQSFYGIPADEIVLQLAFVFRNEDCSLVGRDVNNGDIFYPLTHNYTQTTYVSHEFVHDSLKITCEEGSIVVTPYSTNILNVFSGVEGTENLPSYSVIAEKEIVPVDFSELDNFLLFRTDSIELIIDTTDLSFQFVYENDTILKFLKIYNFEEQGILISTLKNKERIYGTGSRAIDIDRRGKSLAINNQAHYGFGMGAESLNITLPVLQSSERYALMFDNHSIGKLDIGAMNNEQMTYMFSGGQADVFIIAGSNHGELIKNYSILTGHQPMPPLWSLGYIQSKFGYENQTAAYNIVNQIINADFPLDALVLDLYWFGEPGTMGNLEWDNSRFPNPELMMSDFAESGVKTVLITEPYFTQASTNYSFLDAQGYFGKYPNGNTYLLNEFWAGDAALLDLFHPDVPDWFNQFYTERTKEGVAGWWTDLGEPESHPSDMLHYGGVSSSEIHNVYALKWEEIVFENWQTQFPNKRLFNLSRSGFAGMQRYSTFPWSGDVQRSFEGLQAQVPIMLSLGLTGIPFMHSDVGGFTGGGNNDELFARWVQMGVFAPVFRIHGSGIETAPTAYSTYVQTIARKYIKLRYSLLPYNYTLAYEASLRGTPLARPMDFYDMDNESLQNINDQYFWGEGFIVAPVLHQGMNQRDVILPEGKWLSYHNLTEYTGPGMISMPALLTDIPILVKAGSFIPTVKDLQSTDEYVADTLFIQYFPDDVQNESQYTLFDDDKTSSNSIAQNDFYLITFDGFYEDKKLFIDIQGSGQGYSTMPESRQFVFEIFRVNVSEASVLYDESEVTEYLSLNALMQQSLGYFADHDNHKLYVSAPYVNGSSQLKITDVELSDIDNIDKSSTDFILYPNPGSDYLVISGIESKLNQVRLKIFDVDGKLVRELNTPNQQHLKIHTADLKAGVYFVQVVTNDNATVLKWVKHRRD